MRLGVFATTPKPWATAYPRMHAYSVSLGVLVLLHAFHLSHAAELDVNLHLLKASIGDKKKHMSDNFHWEQAGLVAMPETDGHGDTCGVIVIADYLKLLGKLELSINTIDIMRQQLINWGLMNVGSEKGMTVSQVASGFEKYGVTPVKVVGYNANLDFNQFHTDIKNATASKHLVVFETRDAAKLPDGQQGVQYHFVLLGGIDSIEGYLTCNGDTYTALKSKTPVSPVWYKISSLQESGPVGYIILPPIPESTPTPAVVPPPPPPPPPVQAPPPPITAEELQAELVKFVNDLAAFIGGYNWKK